MSQVREVTEGLPEEVALELRNKRWAEVMLTKKGGKVIPNLRKCKCKGIPLVKRAMSTKSGSMRVKPGEVGEWVVGQDWRGRWEPRGAIPDRWVKDFHLYPKCKKEPSMALYRAFEWVFWVHREGQMRGGQSDWFSLSLAHSF